MIDDKFLTLMHKALDNQINDIEKNALDNYLAGNEEARQYYQDLQSVVSNLEEMPLEQAPAGLKSNIMDNLDGGAHRPAANELKMPGPDTWRTVWVFAAGLAAGLFTWGLFGNLFPINGQHQQLRGSLPVEQYDQLNGRFELPIEHPQVAGFARLDDRGNACVLSLYLDSETLLEVLVTAGSEASLRHFAQDKGAKLQLSFDAGQARFFHQGQNQYVLSLDNVALPNDKVELVLRSDDEDIFRQLLPGADSSE